MASINTAQAKWERKMQTAGENWKRGVAGAESRYARGVSEFIGAPVAGHVVSAYGQGVGATTAADFQQAVSGKGSKWSENYRRAMTS